MQARTILEQRSKGVFPVQKQCYEKCSFDRPGITISLMIMYQTYFYTSFHFTETKF